MQSVKDMFADPKFRLLYDNGRCRKYDDNTTYFGSEAFRRYDGKALGRVGPGRPQGVLPTIMLQVGGDGVSLLNFGNRTATVIGIRCEELPPEASQSNLAWRPVIVVEGPKETTALNGIMANTIRQLQEHGPVAMQGAQVPICIAHNGVSMTWVRKFGCDPTARRSVAMISCRHGRTPHASHTV